MVGLSCVDVLFLLGRVGELPRGEWCGRDGAGLVGDPPPVTGPRCGAALSNCGAFLLQCGQDPAGGRAADATGQGEFRSSGTGILPERRSTGGKWT